MTNARSPKARNRADSSQEVASLRAALGDAGTQQSPISAQRVTQLSVAADRLLHGSSPSRAVVDELQRMERECVFTASGERLFQNLLGRLGIDSTREIAIPEDDQPFWFRCDHPLKSYRSRPQLPGDADVVIIGAGLTGASAAYHLREAAREGKRVLVLDK